MDRAAHTLEPVRQLPAMHPEAEHTALLQVRAWRRQSQQQCSGSVNTATLLDFVSNAALEETTWGATRGGLRLMTCNHHEETGELYWIGRDVFCIRRPWYGFQYFLRLQETSGGWNKEEDWSREDSVMTSLYFVLSPVQGLPPPGNPTGAKVKWESKDMQLMDDVVVVDFRTKVLYLAESLPSLCTPLQAKVLELSRHLPQRIHEGQPTASVVQCPDFDMLIKSLFSHKPAPHIPWTKVLYALSEPCRAQLMDMKWHRQEPFDHLCIYTDGSADSEQDTLASWAFAVVTQIQETWRLVAIDAGVVATDPLEPGWTGSEQSGARAGEATALIRAVEWALSESQGAQLSFHYDATSVGNAAGGHWGFERGEIQMKLLRALSQTLQAVKSDQIEWQHVKAHTGVFFNELVDGLAKVARKMQANFHEVERPEYLPFVFGEPDPIEWLWMFVRKEDRQGILPVCKDSSFILPPLCRKMGVQGRLPPKLLKMNDSPLEVDKKLQLSVLTYNVASLQTHKGQMQVAFTREQVQAHELHVACFQETRSKSSNLVISNTHYRIVSAAHAGKGGLETWLLRRRPKTGETFFEKSQIVVLFAHPEMLLVRACFKGTDILLINGHAPHDIADIPVKILMLSGLFSHINAANGCARYGNL